MISAWNDSRLGSRSFVLDDKVTSNRASIRIPNGSRMISEFRSGLKHPVHVEENIVLCDHKFKNQKHLVTSQMN